MTQTCSTCVRVLTARCCGEGRTDGVEVTCDYFLLHCTYTSRCLYRRCGDRAIWRAGECPRPPRPLDNTDSACCSCAFLATVSLAFDPSPCTCCDRCSVYLWTDICPQYLVRLKTCFKTWVRHGLLGVLRQCQIQTCREGGGARIRIVVVVELLFSLVIKGFCTLDVTSENIIIRNPCRKLWRIARRNEHLRSIFSKHRCFRDDVRCF